MSSHDADVRYKAPDVRSRVACLYLPLIGIVAEALPQLYDPNMHAHPRSTTLEDIAGIDQNVAMAIAGSSIYGGTAQGHDESGSKVSASCLKWFYKPLVFGRWHLMLQFFAWFCQESST